MRQHEYRDLLRDAALPSNTRKLDKIIAQFVDAARAREILRAKGYGASGMTAAQVAALVPEVKR